MSASRAAIAGFVLILLASCGRSSAPSASSPFLTLQPLGPPGGTISLDNGTAATLTPGVLATNQEVQVQQNPSEVATAPNPAWQPAPGTMRVKFSMAVPVEPTPAPGATPSVALILTMPYPASNATAILAARAPVVVITYADGNTAKISPNGTFNTSAATVQVTVPRQALDGATGVKMFLATDGIVIVTPSPGPRYWNGTSWQTTPIQLDPAKRTIVFVHGIFSSVESAFPCVSPILAAGGYQQAVGLDYDWTQPPNKEGPLLASFVNSLPNSTVDLEAHSYGTVVTLASLPLVTKTVKNAVLLGGPLPLNGSPQADPGYFRDLLVNLAEFVVPPSQVEDAVKSGMVDSLASDSTAMQTIANAAKSLPSPPSYVQVAGTHPLPFEQYTGVQYLYDLLFDYQPNDGVVEQISAESHDIGQPKISGAFPDDHLQLECDPGIIQFVGSNLTP
jgi:pimeloyl-ACP methyl ester carboxylesterase